ncbi:MAG: hypothetical protein ACRCV9_03520 [Burkholderiaceae bacterium]
MNSVSTVEIEMPLHVRVTEIYGFTARSVDFSYFIFAAYRQALEKMQLAFMVQNHLSGGRYKEQLRENSDALNVYRLLEDATEMLFPGNGKAKSNLLDLSNEEIQEVFTIAYLVAKGSE